MYLNVGALYFVRACIRSLAKCCWADKVGCVIFDLSLHQPTCRSYALKPNDLPQCGHTSFIGDKDFFIDLVFKGVSALLQSNFDIVRCGLLLIFNDAALMFEKLAKLELYKWNRFSVKSISHFNNVYTIFFPSNCLLFLQFAVDP